MLPVRNLHMLSLHNLVNTIELLELHVNTMQSAQVVFCMVKIDKITNIFI